MQVVGYALFVGLALRRLISQLLADSYGILLIRFKRVQDALALGELLLALGELFEDGL